MNRILSLSIVVLLVGLQDISAQQMTADELIKKSLKVHDPKNEWHTFSDSLIFKQIRPSGEESYRRTYLDLQQSSFYFKSRNKDGLLEYVVTKTGGHYLWNGAKPISEELKETYRVSDDRATMYQNYYLYLYGMPMKLSDPGTHIDPKVEEVNFKGKEYLRIRAHYDPAVGKDIWYFYFNPQSYVLEMYQFYHDESINDGEYIYLDGAARFGNLRLPKSIKWYMNKDDRFLGEDVIVNGR